MSEQNGDGTLVIGGLTIDTSALALSGPFLRAVREKTGKDFFKALMDLAEGELDGQVIQSIGAVIVWQTLLAQGQAVEWDWADQHVEIGDALALIGKGSAVEKKLSALRRFSTDSLTT